MVDSLYHVTGRWWAFVLRGVLAVLFGILAWLWPGLTVTVLVILFGAYALTDGIFSIIAAFQQRDRGRDLWPLIFAGIAGIGLGIVVLLWPGLSALALIYWIAAWALVTGVLQIVAAIRMRKVIENEWLLGLGGLASIVFGLIAFAFPGSGAIALVWLIGIYAVVFGIILIMLGIRLRSLHQRSTTA